MDPDKNLTVFNPTNQSIRSALISVSDKSGLDALAKALSDRGVALYSTGGTLKYLQDLGLPAQSVESLTKFPEMMDGRLKTLHPKVFGGILGRRDHEGDVRSMREHEIPNIDLVVVNLYPFAKFLGQAMPKQIENIDIGGPSLLRAAAKNHAFVTVLSDPHDYTEFLEEWSRHAHQTRYEFRRAMAQRTFQRTSRYDQMISAEWAKLVHPDAGVFPSQLSLSPQSPLRYGENPHQKAVFAGSPTWKLLQGKELSYNNILDAEAAVRLVHDFKETSCAIIKHGNPCGVGSGEPTALQSFQKALQADSMSAFGGIVSFNCPVDGDAARALSEIFLEVITAPQFSADAVRTLSKKSNLRLVQWESPTVSPFEVRAALGGWLIQDTDTATTGEDFQTVSTRQPDAATMKELMFAWTVCKHVRSNAIVVSRGLQTAGIGAGQMSRIDSVKIAIEKAGPSRTSGAVLASDAFFPFRDNVDAIAPTGIRAIVSPNGSKNDAQVIDACNEHGLVLVFAPHRHFRH